MRCFFLVLLMFISFAASVQAESLKIDGSSKEAYEKSVKAMADELSPEDKEVFSKGLINLIITRYPPAAGAEGLTLLQFMQPAIESAHIYMNGVTAEDILARGRQLSASQGQPPGSQSVQNETIACLQKMVRIENAAFEKGDYSYYAKYSVTNNLPYAIGGIWIAYEIRSDGRSVPWEKNDFVSSIAGGVEPGETRELSHSFSMLSSSTPPTAKVTLRVIDVSDAENRLVVKTRGVMGWPDEKSPHGCKA